MKHDPLVSAWAERKIASFSYRADENAYKIGQPTMGARYDFVSVTLTTAQYLDPKVQSWIRDCILPRLGADGMLSVHVENP